MNPAEVTHDYQVWKGGDRCSKPTKQNRIGIGKTLATCGDNFRQIQAIAD
jgi:hypothetical protein